MEEVKVRDVVGWFLLFLIYLFVKNTFYLKQELTFFGIHSEEQEL